MRQKLRQALFVCCLVPLAVDARAVVGHDRRLVEAVKAGKLDEVSVLLRAQVDVNAREGDGSTALHWAVHRGDLATVDALLRAGALVNVSTDTGTTPLYLACTNRDDAMVEKLVAAGADSNAALLSSETALMECARTGNP